MPSACAACTPARSRARARTARAPRRTRSRSRSLEDEPDALDHGRMVVGEPRVLEREDRQRGHAEVLGPCSRNRATIRREAGRRSGPRGARRS